jgi:hypothetical protein
MKEWLLIEPGGGVSWMPYAPEGATGIKRLRDIYVWPIVSNLIYFLTISILS